MKIIKITIAILLIFIVSDSFSQSVKNKQFSLIGYDLTISKEFTEEVSCLEPFIKEIGRAHV